MEVVSFKITDLSAVVVLVVQDLPQERIVMFVLLVTRSKR